MANSTTTCQLEYVASNSSLVLETYSLHGCRTIEDIIWSCLITIFACTWVALHPNIPDPSEKQFAIAGRRLGVMIMALVAPELVVLWALRQRFVARELARRHKGWTETHAFFAIMGGFMFFDDSDEKRTVQLKDFKSLEEHSDLPQITKAEIEDRSKGDMVSKGLAVIQTGWFLLQCIGRRAEGLPVTELEIVTVAFAVLNFAIYGLWWEKPLNVQRPFRVKWQDKYEMQVDKHGDESVHKTPMWDKIRRVTLFPLLPFNRMAKGDDHMEEGAKRVPTFHPEELKPGRDRQLAIIIGICIATIFGGIHCAGGWESSSLEFHGLLTWRTASFAITALPVVIWGFATIAENLIKSNKNILSIVSAWICGICSTIYFLARVTLLVLAFESLQSLPPKAYQTVLWSSFIPHF